MGIRRTAVVLAATAGGFVLGAASYSWACSASAYLAPLNPSTGPRGTEVTVAGSSWAESTATNPNVGPVEIRWGSETGPLLATAQGPSFSATVTIPDGPPGYYLITATAWDGNGQAVGRQSRTFRLTGAPALSPGGTGGTVAPPTSPTASAGTGPAGTASPEPDAPATATEPTGAEPVQVATAPAAQTGASNPGVPPAPAAAQATQVADARTPAPPAPAAATGRSSLAPAAPAPAPAAVAQGPPVGEPRILTDEVPAPVVADGALPTEAVPVPDASDLWTDGASDRPSLVSEPAGAGRGLSSPAAAFLSVGLLGLFGGTLAVTVRRRQRLADADRR